MEGANFDPTFLKLACHLLWCHRSLLTDVSQNPKATLPTLEADGNVYTSTAEVVSYLVNGASVQVDAEAKEIIDIIHEEQYDPNFALLLFVRHPSRFGISSDCVHSSSGMMRSERQKQPQYLVSTSHKVWCYTIYAT